MKKITLLLSFITILLFDQASYAQTFDWENGTLSQTVGGITATVTASSGPPSNVNGGGFGGTSGQIIITDDTSYTITFTGGPINITSINTLVTTAPPGAANILFTPTGGSNTAVTEEINYQTGEVVDLNWTGVTSIELSVVGGVNEVYGFDDIIFTAPPTFENSTPSSSLITQTGFTLETDISEAGTIYYVVVTDGASAPTAAEVKAETGSGGSGQITSGNAIVSTGGFTNDFSVTGLTPGTAYDVYTVAEDNDPTLQTNPTKIDVTAAAIPITITGLTGDTKEYDNTNIASASGTATLSGVVGGDDVTLGGTPVYTFGSENVGTGITITTTGYTISGTDVGKYILTQPTLSADITTKELTVSGITGDNKEYDGTTTVIVSGTATLSGVIGADDVTLGGSPVYTFTSATAGTGITITTSGYTISGTDLGNYTLAQPTLSADITPKILTVTGLTGNTKEYDDTTLASASGAPSLSGTLGGDIITLGGTPTYAFTSENVGTGITITTTGFTISGANVQNYSITQPTLSADITPKTLTITGLTGDNKIYDGTTTASVSGTPSFTGIIGSDQVTIDGASVYAFASETVGTGITISSSITLSGADAGNYTITQPTSLSAAITPKALTLEGILFDNKQYDRNTSATFNAATTFDFTGLVGSDDVILSVDGAFDYNFASSNVGTGIEILFTNPFIINGTDAGNYTIIQPIVTADITPKALTVEGIGSASNKEYDGTTAVSVNGTPSLGGVLGSDDVIITGPPIYTFVSKNVGFFIEVTTTDYMISGTEAGNYTVTQPASLSANITEKEITITGLIIANKVYDATTDATVSGTASLVGVEAGDDVTLSATSTFSSNGINAQTGVSFYADTPFTISGIDAANYDLTQPVLMADITPKPIPITGLTGDTKEYNGTTVASASGTATLVGVESGDDVLLDGTPSYTFASANAGTGITIATTGYTISDADADNYTITQPTLSADITPKAITISGLTGANKIYDGTTSASVIGTATLVGIETGDVVTFDGTSTYDFTSANTGTGITITATATISGTDAINYTVTQPTLSANITAKEVTITGITGDNKEYDGSTLATASGTATLVGIETGDVVTLDGTPAYTFASADIGTGITITTSGFTISGTDAGNYTVTQPTLSADITLIILTVTGLTGTNKVYDGTNAASVSGIATLAGVESGDVVTLDGTPAYTFTTANTGGGITITTTGFTISGADAGNYSLTQPTLSADITAKEIAITGITGANKVYDGTTVASVNGTATLVGIETGDVVTLDGTPTYNFTAVNTGGGITITTTGFIISGADAGNYSLTQPTLSADITAKEITITGITGANKVYDGTTLATASGTATLVGIETGDDVTLGGTPAYTFTSADIGSGITITTSGFTISGTDAANYTVTQPTLSADITLITLTVTGITGTNKVYDGTTAASVSGTATLAGVETGDVVTLEGTPAYTFTTANTGGDITITTTGFTISGANAGNYSLTQPTLSADITAKEVTITGITGDNKEYDGTTLATASGTATLAGIETGDDVTLDGTPAYTFTTANTGGGITITTTGFTISGANAGNYILLQPVVTADITPEELTITGLAGANKVYDGTTVASVTGNPSLVGVLGSDDAQISGTPTYTFTSENTGAGITITTTGFTISGANAGNYSLTQPTLSADITAKEVTIAGLTANNKQVDGTTTATVSGTAVLVGIETGDIVTLSGTPVFTFASPNVGVGITVTTTAYTITGADEANYSLTQPSLSADITEVSLLSITRQTPTTSLTNADVLIWDITFNGAVINVDPTDFEVSGTTATITAVSNPTGNIYSVTASGGDLSGLNGIVTLNFAANQNITDTSGGAITNTTPSGTNDTTFLVDNDSPTVVISSIEVSPTANSPISITINFSKDVSVFIIDGIIVGNGTVSNIVGGGLLYTVDITPTATGQVTVDINENTVFDAAGNGNIVAIQYSIMYDATLSNDEFTETSFAVYPNPTSDEVNISIPLEKVSVYNITGQKVFETNASIFSIQELPTGVYFLQIQTEKGTVTKKILKD